MNTLQQISEIVSRDQVFEYNYAEVKQFLHNIQDLPRLTGITKNLKFYGISNDKNEIVGIIVIDMHPTEVDNPFNLTQSQMIHGIEIKLFYMEKESRYAGGGTKILNFIVNKFHDKYIGLRTGRKTSDAAFHLYKKFGFKVVNKGILNSPLKWWLRAPSK